MSHINEEIRAEMGRQRVTYADLGRAIGITRQAVQQKLTRELSISHEDLEAFSKVLNVPMWEIVRRAEEQAKVIPA